MRSLSTTTRLSASAADRLAVVETAGGYLVVRAGDPKDWLVRFDEGDGFPARAWAENMVRIYNARHVGRRVDTFPPGARPASYHPGEDGPDDGSG